MGLFFYIIDQASIIIQENLSLGGRPMVHGQVFGLQCDRAKEGNMYLIKRSTMHEKLSVMSVPTGFHCPPKTGLTVYIFFFKSFPVILIFFQGDSVKYFFNNLERIGRKVSLYPFYIVYFRHIELENPYVRDFETSQSFTVNLID